MAIWISAFDAPLSLFVKGARIRRRVTKGMMEAGQLAKDGQQNGQVYVRWNRHASETWDFIGAGMEIAVAVGGS